MPPFIALYNSAIFCRISRIFYGTLRGYFNFGITEVLLSIFPFFMIWNNIQKIKGKQVFVVSTTGTTKKRRKTLLKYIQYTV